MIDLGERNLIQSLSSTWIDAYKGTAETVFPGQDRDMSGCEKWNELQVPVIRELPRVNAGMRLQRVNFDVHCFVRRGSDPKVVLDEVDSVRKALGCRTWGVRDYTDEARPVIGVVRTQEVEVRDLTRLEQRVLGSELAHVLVSCRGFAQTTEFE